MSASALLPPHVGPSPHVIPRDDDGEGSLPPGAMLLLEPPPPPLEAGSGAVGAGMSVLGALSGEGGTKPSGGTCPTGVI